MRVTIPTLAAAISLTVFACSESPLSPSTDDSSSSGIPSSSSSILGGVGSTCEYSGIELGLGSGLFACMDIPSDMPDLQKIKTECEQDGGTWANTCPSGEKATCISEEDNYEKIVLYKLYANDFSCGDLMLKNADGSEDIVPKGGACGPFLLEGISVFMCAEFPEMSTGMIKLSCSELETSFADKCPGNATLTCYAPEDEMISHFYGSEISSFTCEDFDMEEL